MAQDSINPSVDKVNPVPEAMWSDFYDVDQLRKGLDKMVNTIEEINEQSQSKTSTVLPDVQPGFLRNQMPTEAPEIPMDIEKVVDQTKEKIVPGTMLWGSNKYFGFFPSNVSFTNIIADAFGDTFHSPGFSYIVSPAHTELENIVVDWTAKALGLPDQFQLKNSGGGAIMTSVTEIQMCTVHAAKRRKMRELGITSTDPRILKLAGYYTDFCHAGAERGLKNKEIPHVRKVPSKYDSVRKNLVVDFEKFKKMLQHDLDQGLIPFWYGFSYGTTFSAADDLQQPLISLCKSNGIWIEVDAAYLGASWFCQDQRPDKKLLEQVDSIAINFGKAMFQPVAALLYVADKHQYTASFGQCSEFSFYQNKFTSQNDVVDYKDWTFGEQRHNNAIKFYFMYMYYGVERLRVHIRSCIRQVAFLQQKISQNPDLFQMFCQPRFGLVCFQVKTKNGVVSNKLTEEVGLKIKNTSHGFSTPSNFKTFSILRIAIGNPNSDEKDIQVYWKTIVEAAKQTQASFYKRIFFSLFPAMFKERFFKNRCQCHKAVEECMEKTVPDLQTDFSKADFQNYLPTALKSLKLIREVTKEECNEIFEFYDDEQSGSLPRQKVFDIAWDIYTSEVANDRVIIHQMLQKIITEKCCKRVYKGMDPKFFYGPWGRRNLHKDWKSSRCNPYQLQELEKYGFKPKTTKVRRAGKEEKTDVKEVPKPRRSPRKAKAGLESNLTLVSEQTTTISETSIFIATDSEKHSNSNGSSPSRELPDFENIRYIKLAESVDPFFWEEIHSIPNAAAEILMPSPSQLSEKEQKIDLEMFGVIADDLQESDISFVTDMKHEKKWTPKQALEALKGLNAMMEDKGYDGDVSIKHFYAETVNLMEGCQENSAMTRVKVSNGWSDTWVRKN